MRLKLITYNIWHGTKLDGVVEFLKQEPADIVCLQEVGTQGRGLAADETTNIYEFLAQALGMKGEYRRMLWGDIGKGQFDLGVAIFSRLPMGQTVDFRYERTKDIDEILEPALRDRFFLPRVLLGVELTLGQRKLWVMTTHMTITSDAGESNRQKESIIEVKGFLKNYEEYILCGDMNIPYGTETYRLLADGLADISNPKEPTLHPTVHKVGEMGYHVDYVFLKSETIKPILTRIPVIEASDHLPVVVELEVY